MTYVGIDVSKLTFVVAYSSAKTSKTKTFKNTAKGIREFIKTISVDEHHCVMEATGNYSTLLVYMLSEFGFTVSLENPLKIKNFSRVMRNHSIFRHDDFIGCFSADKIKKSVRKYFCFNIPNIPIYKNMAEEPSCRSPYHEEYIQTSVSGNPEDLYRSTYSFLSERR